MEEAEGTMVEVASIGTLVVEGAEVTSIVEKEGRRKNSGNLIQVLQFVIYYAKLHIL